MALALSGGIIGFLMFNFGQAQIFMGDNGSTFIGVMLSFFTISFFQNHALNGGVITWQPILVLALLAVPLFDMAKVVLSRMARGRSPFKGDRTHIHHLLQQVGMKQDMVCYLLYVWSAIVIILAIQFVSNNIIVGGLTLALIGSLPYVAMYVLLKSHKEEKQSKLHANKASDIV